jgi:hypothetical protein
MEFQGYHRDSDVFDSRVSKAFLRFDTTAACAISRIARRVGQVRGGGWREWGSVEMNLVNNLGTLAKTNEEFRA